MANTNGYRFIRGANNDSTYQTVTQDMQTVAYATTYAALPAAQTNLYLFAALTGAMTITADTVQPKWGDTMEFQFTASGADRTVTLSTGITGSATTLVVVSAKFGNIKFTFTDNGWIETSRTLTA